MATAIDLTNSGIGDTEAQYLAGLLRANSKISKLLLGSNRISDEGATYLVDVLQNNAVNIFFFYMHY
ncbi:unnamed protein product [Rotaria socialis]|uniref:Uncharacterized protein n=1 Tax=Rotaria socialis TaxID=392032 RepID=A0A818XY03_9BILA|nr:unnamed protein product [Rotaria socialis]